MTDQEFKQLASEYIDIMIGHCRQIAEEEHTPTSEEDMLKLINYLVNMKLAGIE